MSATATTTATKRSDFREDLHFADTARLRLNESFYPAICKDGRFVVIDRSVGSMYLQKHCHIDCVAAAKSGGSVTIEEKIVRWPGYHYTAMTVETHSNLERTGHEPIGDGWIRTSTADFLLYAFQQEDRRLSVWMFSLPLLRAWFTPVAEQFKVTDISNRIYTTRCRVVPLSAIPDECIRVRRRMV